MRLPRGRRARAGQRPCTAIAATHMSRGPDAHALGVMHRSPLQLSMSRNAVCLPMPSRRSRFWSRHCAASVDADDIVDHFELFVATPCAVPDCDSSCQIDKGHICVTRQQQGFGRSKPLVERRADGLLDKLPRCINAVADGEQHARPKHRATAAAKPQTPAHAHTGFDPRRRPPDVRDRPASSPGGWQMMPGRCSDCARS